MKKRMLARVMALCLALSLLPVTAGAADVEADTSWYTGEATEYTLTTAAQLWGLNELLGDNDFEGITISLGNNIVLNDTSAENWWESATEWAVKDFDGTFNGGNYTITGLCCTDRRNVGFFGKLNGTIQNVTFVNAYITATSTSVGAFAGTVGGGALIQNCSLENSIVTGRGTVGGICGSSSTNSKIEECTVGDDCIISATSSPAGGIVGSASGTIESCRNEGQVSGGNSTGGIVGNANNPCAIISCQNTGTITGTENGGNIGGILGRSGDYNGISISACTNSGAITGGNNVGGIVGGLFTNCTVTNCVSEGPVTGTQSVGGIAGKSDIGVGNYLAGSPNTITNCTVSATVTGTTNVGGVLGENVWVDDSDKKDTTIANNVLTATASVTGTTSVGAIIGDNSQMQTDGGTIKNNFWPTSAGNVVGSGMGSASTETTITTANSSYQNDGTLTTPITSSDGTSTISNLGDALEKVTGGSVPEAMRVTVTYNNGGHGTAPDTVEVTMGTKITLPTMSDDGYYTFTGWTSGNETYPANTEVTVMKDTTFTAKWQNNTPSQPEPSQPSGGSGPATYSPTLDVSDGGTVRVSPRTPEAGDTVTITPDPDSGYMVGGVTVTGRDGDAVRVTANRNGTYTFTQPRGRVTIAVTFVRETGETTFSDVPETYWAYDEIQWAYENGYVNGTSASTFAPGASISRQQVWMILARLSGVAPADMAAARAWAMETGVSDGTNPGAAVTRQQLAALLFRFAQANGYDDGQRGDLSRFPDAGSAASYAVEPLQWATAGGILNGTSQGTLNPAGTATRAQFAVMLYRFWNGL